MKTNVIFDTCAYRNLTLNCSVSAIEEKLKHIKLAEAEKGITVHLSIIVLTELLNHLSKNEQDLNERDNCLNGIVASILHGRNQTGIKYDFKYRPSLNNIVLYDIFDIIDENEKIYNGSVLRGCDDITNGILKGKTIEQIKDNSEIANAIEINKMNCIYNRINEFEIFSQIIKGFNPNVNLEKSEIGEQKIYKSLTKGQGKEEKFALIMAKTYLHGTAQYFKKYNLSVSENEMKLFISIYKSAMKNMQDFFIKFNAGTKFNDLNRDIWNTINDSHILMNCYVKNEKVILVTGDQKMKYETSANFQKMKIDEYLKILGTEHFF